MTQDVRGAETDWRHLAAQAPTGPAAGKLLELLTALPVDRVLHWLDRHPTLHGLALTGIGMRSPIFIDHATEPEPRPANAGIAALIEANRERYAARLAEFVSHADRLAEIAVRADPHGADPYWDNGWLPPLDALGLYGTLAARRPNRYLEIGSGNSTRFARRAITDHGLATTITSIDPAPRATIDPLCDTVLRTTLQRADLSVFAELQAGDVVFLDGSHRVLMGSDVTVFFLEVLPLLAPGVLVHIHDIMLPRDYPHEWRWRYYSEQYLLAAFLVADPDRFRIELPNAFIAADPALSAGVEPLWRRLGVTEHYLASSFWLTVGAAR